MTSRDRIDASRQAVVDLDYYWRDIQTAPLGVKVQLLTSGGVAIHGKINRRDKEDNFYIGWTPLPKIPAFLKEKM